MTWTPMWLGAFAGACARAQAIARRATVAGLGVAAASTPLLLSGCAAGKGDGLGPPGAQGTDPGTGGRPGDDSYTPGLVPIEEECEDGYEITIKSANGRYLRDDDSVSPDDCHQEIDWTDPDVPTEPRDPPPPDHETYECPEGYTRVHVRDMWSNEADPSLNEF